MPRPDVSDERIPQILEAALKVFNRKGLAASRMEDIARQAKLSIGGVYWYYKSKDDVVLAIMDKVIDEDVAILRNLLNEPATVQERLRKYLQIGVQESMQYTTLTYELYTLSKYDAKVRHHIQTYIEHYINVLTELIQQGMNQKEFRQANARSIAFTIAALYEGTLELVTLDSSIGNIEEMLNQSLDIIFKEIVK